MIIEIIFQPEKNIKNKYVLYPEFCNLFTFSITFYSGNEYIIVTIMHIYFH